MVRTTLLALLASSSLLLGSAACSGGSGKPDEQPQTDPQGSGEKALSEDQIEEIRKTVQQGTNSAIDCYTAELERRGDKKLQGKVVVRILIGTTGAVQQVEIGEDELKVPAIKTCILAAVRKWDFPKISTAFWYTAPFQFSPAY
jgi:outer membrane biosynthesis protein TonB